MGRAVSEDCQAASATLLHPVNPLPSITRSARLIPLPRAARCKSPLGCLLIAHEVWRLESSSSANLADSAILPTDKISTFFMQNFLLQKPKDSSWSMPLLSPQGKNNRLRYRSAERTVSTPWLHIFFRFYIFYTL